jgi:hypothetical protein
MTTSAIRPEVLLSEAQFCGTSAALYVVADPDKAAQFARSAWRFAEAYAATGSAAHRQTRTVDWKAVKNGRV